uniref:Ig-like domain-containing protein n=1 Tax=Myripristis murdjan TaxID=586833 RepID=A0A667YUF1_9TELE
MGMMMMMISWVIGSPQPIVALAGDDVILPCHLEPAISDFSDTVEWTREDLDPPYLHVHQSGRLLVQLQNPLYKYRTILFVDELKNGNVSLKLFTVTISDEGRYLCFIPSMRRGDFIQLNVGESRGLVSQTTTSYITLFGDDVILPCRLEPAIRDFSDMVEWIREDIDPPHGQDDHDLQQPQYTNRTILSHEDLIKGNLSLKLLHVQLSDQGNYTCSVVKLSEKEKITRGHVILIGKHCKSIRGRSGLIKQENQSFVYLLVFMACKTDTW